MSSDPVCAADQLLVDFDTMRATLSYAVIEELHRRVEAHKFQDPVRALQIADTAVMAATALDTPPAIALAAWTKATALLFNGRTTEALPYYRQAEQIYGELGQPVEQVGVQAPLVYALNAVGDTVAALALATQVQCHCCQLGTPANRALAHLEMNIGTIRKQQGAFLASLAACDRAKALFVTLSDAEGAARAELNRANVLQEMDRFAEAADAYAAARLPLVQSQRNRQQVALIDFNLGLLAERRGHFVEALHYLEAAHDGFTPSAHKAATNLNRALIYNRLNLPTEAHRLAQLAQESFAANAMRLENGHALLVIGNAERQLGRIAAAESAFHQAAASFEEHQAAFWLATAHLALAQPQQTESSDRDRIALATAVQARADAAEWPTLAVEARLTRVRHMMAREVNSKVNLAASILDLLHESIELAEGYYLTLLALDAYALLGRYYRQIGAHRKAERAYLQTILYLEEVRMSIRADELQLGYLADKAQLYTEAAALFCRADAGPRADAMLLYLLNLAAVAPLPLTTTDMDANDTETVALCAELRHLQEVRQWQQHKVTDPALPRDALRTSLAQLEGQITDCWRRIQVRQQGHGHDTTTHTADRHDIKVMWSSAVALQQAIQQQLQSDEALVVYARIDDQLMALIVRQENSSVVPIGDGRAAEKLLAAWRFHSNDHRLIQQAPALAQATAQRILATFHRTLFAPLVPHLGHCRRLYLTVPPSLHDLPVAAFWADGYLLNHYELVHLTAPSALLRHARRAAAPQRPQALVIGHSHNGRLPHTVAEATTVAAILATETKPTLLCETAATVDAFLSTAGAATYIHIAAHAHFAPAGPLFSAIHLADRELPLLDLYHGAHLQQQPLVVLSTCVSGQGIARGGGLVGLARAFFAAGAGHLVATNWQIDDTATAKLMGIFYQQLVADPKHADPGAALHNAQRRLAAEYHPFYWAGFVYVQG